MNADVITSAAAAVGGGFFGGLLFGYAIKKVVKLIAVIAGLFIAGLAYLQYQQIAFFDWNRIESLFTNTLGNVTANITNNQEVATLAMSNFGIQLTGSMSAGFAVGFKGVIIEWIKTMFLQEIAEHSKVLLIKE